MHPKKEIIRIPVVGPAGFVSLQVGHLLYVNTKHYIKESGPSKQKQ